MKRKANRLGVLSGLTKEFNISRKARFHDPVVLVVNGQKISKSVKTWIETAPDIFYNQYYKKGGAVCLPVSKALKEALSQKFPSLLEEIVERRSHHRKK